MQVSVYAGTLQTHIWPMLHPANVHHGTQGDQDFSPSPASEELEAEGGLKAIYAAVSGRKMQLEHTFSITFVRESSAKSITAVSIELEISPG